jgi:hypothetical protein
MNRDNLEAYDLGMIARQNDWPRTAPYAESKISLYWLSGFDGTPYDDVVRADLDSRKDAQASMGYSRIGVNNRW